jgi:ribosomal protein L40E
VDQRTYHGDLNPDEIANALLAQFNQGNFVAQRLSQGDRVTLQVGTRDERGRIENALAVTISKMPDGVNIAVGEQQWLGAAADLAQAGLGALFNPLSLLRNLDDIARDVSSFALPEQIWQVVDRYSKSVGAGLGGSPSQMTVTCAYCGVANPVGAPACLACGAGLGEVQPVYCSKCGEIAPHDAKFCSRCGAKLMVN